MSETEVRANTASDLYAVQVDSVPDLRLAKQPSTTRSAT